MVVFVTFMAHFCVFVGFLVALHTERSVFVLVIVVRARTYDTPCMTGECMVGSACLDVQQRAPGPHAVLGGKMRGRIIVSATNTTCSKSLVTIEEVFGDGCDVMHTVN